MRWEIRCGALLKVSFLGQNETFLKLTIFCPFYAVFRLYGSFLYRFLRILETRVPIFYAIFTCFLRDFCAIFTCFLRTFYAIFTRKFPLIFQFLCAMIMLVIL